MDEKGYTNRDVHKKIERQRVIGKKLRCKFVRINPAAENYDIFIEIDKIHNHVIKSNYDIFTEIDKIHNHVIKSTKKSLIDRISKTLLKLDLKKTVQ